VARALIVDRARRMAARAPRKPPAKRARTGARGCLDGVRVLDLTQVVAGPFCTGMLASLGAEVVKLEPLGRGDELRWIGRYAGRAAHEDYFNANNHSKKSIALDLKDPEQRAIGRALAVKADVLVENYAPGTARRLGMGWPGLRRINPRLVYCSISGFGQTGPYSGRKAMDPVIQAISGVMSVTGEPDGPPLMVGTPLADVIAGMFAAYAVAGALHAVRTDGRGRHVDLSMQAAMIAAIGPRMGEPLQADRSPRPLGNQNPMRVPSDVYFTADRVPVFVMVQNDRLWAPFCRALDRTGWIDDPRFADNVTRVKHRKAMNDLVTARFLELRAGEVIPRLEDEAVPFARVNDYGEALADPQLAHRGTVRTVRHPTSGPIRVIGPPWIMTGDRVKPFPPPLLGQHTAEVLRSWLGWSRGKSASFEARLAAAPAAAR